jgi:hypothetical protein
MGKPTIRLTGMDANPVVTPGMQPLPHIAGHITGASQIPHDVNLRKALL